jgi:hypothetical protein
MVSSWAGCHSWYQSNYMHQSLINNFNHWFLNKNCQDCLDCKIHWSVKDKLDREALEGIFGFFHMAYQSMVYFANS